MEAGRQALEAVRTLLAVQRRYEAGFNCWPGLPSVGPLGSAFFSGPFGTYVEMTEGLDASQLCQCASMNAAICFIAASPLSPILDMMLPCVRSAISTVSTSDPAFESSVFSRSFCARRQSSSPSA